MNELTLAIANLIEAKTERDRAWKSCDASWGYFGQRYEDNLRKAEEEFQSELMKLINNAINERLAAK